MKNSSKSFKSDYHEFDIIPEYPYSLNFYTKKPEEEIGLSEFKALALKRWHLLKDIESVQVQNSVYSENENNLFEIIQKKNPLPLNVSGDGSGVTPEIMYYQRREDLISHYILRLAYCEQEDKKEWFINQECNLFKMRWERNKNNYEKKEFLKTLNLPMEVVSEEEKYKLKDDMFNNETYYKIPFEVVTDLVQNRTVFIKKGNAYVPLSNQISVIINEFRQNLKRSLDYLGENFSKMKIKEDERLYSIIKKIADNNVYETYKPSNNGEIKYQDIPRIAQYFPLCMKRLQDELVINSHLRHGGRMQYGLFLKGINLPLDESLKFWRHAFNKMTEDQFQKGYAYNIRHNYGKEGKRADYRPYSCNKIIMGNPPSTGEYHGCPFRHSPIEVLEVMLRKRGIKESTITQIIAFTRSQHYQLACRAMLEEVSGISAVKLENISYPNDYFNQCYPGSEIYKNLIKASNQEDTQNIDEMEF